MTYYLRFNADGEQVEASYQITKPEEEGWYKAPKSFSFDNRYRLHGGKVRKEKASEAAACALAEEQAQYLRGLPLYMDALRQRYGGYSAQKVRGYEAQARAAARALEAHAAEETLDLIDVEILQPLADVRGISVIDMAELIQIRCDEADMALALIDAYEDKAELLIENAQNSDMLTKDYAALTAAAEKALSGL